jgi:hypothetical protein
MVRRNMFGERDDMELDVGLVFHKIRYNRAHFGYFIAIDSWNEGGTLMPRQ